MDIKEQQELFELQSLQKKMEEFSKKIDKINEQLTNIYITKEALEKIQSTKTGTEILSQLADGIFIKTELKENSKAIVNVGANTTCEKSIPQVIEMLEGHQENLMKQGKTAQKLMETTGNKILEKINSLESEN